MPSALHRAVFGRPALPADSLTDQAARWADHVFRTLPPEGACPERSRRITRKALDAVAFSLRHGLRDLSVPSKLVGVAAHQHAVEALALGACPERSRRNRLPVEDRPRLVVSHTLDVHALRSDRSLQHVGRVQPKHAPWLAPLLGRGAALHLHRVTGLDRRARGLPVTLGVNVRIVGIARALDRLAAALAPRHPAPLTIVAETPTAYDAGGGEPTALAVRLWRDADGTARMTCPHVVRHSPTGPEWGHPAEPAPAKAGGPADCARSVLLALTDEATADAHYQDFKAEVIARLPEHGAVIQRTVALVWLAGRAEAHAETTASRAA